MANEIKIQETRRSTSGKIQELNQIIQKIHRFIAEISQRVKEESAATLSGLNRQIHTSMGRLQV